MGNKTRVIWTRNLFSFWAVGQGLFYTAKIDIYSSELPDRLDNPIGCFNILYDIGTLSKRERLNQIVNGYFTNKKFHLCFISHFHEDHVNGLKILKENNVYIERLTVPYVSPIELIALSLSSEDDWYISFIINPYLWILKNLNVKNIYVWGSGKEKPYFSEFPSMPEDYSLDDRELFKDVIKDNEEIKEQFFSDYPELREDDGKIKFPEQGGYFEIRYLWIFLPFYLEAEKAKLEEFQKCLKEKGIENITTDIIMEKCNVIAECYNKLFGDLNLTSLTLYHQPIIYNKSNYGINVITPFKGYIKMSNSGQFLLGDINLNTQDRYEEFKQFYKNYLKKDFVFQVPHHGASKNWNKAFLKDFSSMYWIINAGKSNIYRHPSEEVISDICQSGKCPVWVHEDWKEDRFLIEQCIHHWW